MSFKVFDPRTLGKEVYDKLVVLRKKHDKDFNAKQIAKERKISKEVYRRLKEQKNQAVELYTYLATWGLMRLKAEQIEGENKQVGKREVIQGFFECLENLRKNGNSSDELNLNRLKKMNVDEYLGLTGLALALAQEFAFWASAIYFDVSGDDYDDN